MVQKHVTLENITFVGCSKPNHKVDPENITSIVSIDFASLMYMESCYFPDYVNLGLSVKNTDSVVLNNSYFRASKEVCYRRAVEYKRTVSKDVKFYANNLTLDGGNVSYQIDLHNYHSYKSEAIEIGGSLALIMYYGGSVKIHISDSKILNSDAVLGGGVFFEMSEYVIEYNIEIISCHFENNTAMKPKIGKGGAMALRAVSGNRGKVTIKNTTFLSNSAISGGAIAILLNDRVGESNFEINGSEFRKNSASKNSGGAVYAENFYLSSINVLTINNTQFYKNVANSGGAILTMNFLLCLLNNVSMIENSAYYGGGVCLLGSSLKFKGNNIVFEKNMANHSGGALYLHSLSSVLAYGNETLITNNAAMIRGGGIFVFTKYFEDQIESDNNSWRDKGRMFDFKCFLKAKAGINTSLILSDNKVKNDTDLCMGDDLFTNTWGPCYNMYKDIPISPSIVFKNVTGNNCSIALDIVKYSERSHFLSPCQLDIQSGSNFTHNCLGTLELEYLPIYKHRLTQAIKRQGLELEGKAHLFFPGFESQINIKSLDGRNNPIQTLTQIIFKHKNASFLDNKQYHVLGISRSGKFKFTIKKLKEEFAFGQICLLSYSTLNIIHHCEDAIIGECPSPLLLAGLGESCEISSFPKFNGKTFVEENPDNFTIRMTSGTLLYYPQHSSTETVLKHCTWFQCRCHITANPENCTFNVNAPAEQCREGLKYPYCTECIDKNDRICPPFSWFCGDGVACFKCKLPSLMIVV